MAEINEVIARNISSLTEVNVKYDSLVRLIKKPKNGKGDLSLPCFEISKDPVNLAKIIEKEASFPKEIRLAKAQGPYVNFFYNDSYLVETVLEEIINSGEEYGKSSIGNGKTIVLDYSGPNHGKPLHVGHIRSTIIGDSLINLLKFTGHNTIGINYIGDAGLHIGKIIVALDLWGDQSKLQSDPEGAILDLYVRFNQEEKNDDQ